MPPEWVANGKKETSPLDDRFAAMDARISMLENQLVGMSTELSRRMAESSAEFEGAVRKVVAQRGRNIW